MNTTKTLLITRPNHDIITTYLFKWSTYVIQEAIKKGVKVLDLSEQKANNKTLVSYIEKNKPILVFFNGHGNKDMIAGYNDEALIESDKNEKLLACKIVYARSCDAANNLGHLCIKNKTLTFIGYKRKYTLVYTMSKSTNPLSDQVAKLFLEPSNLIPISLVKGNNAKEAFRKSQEAMFRNFSYMLSTKATQLQKDSASFLWANRKSQVMLGDENTHI